MSGKELNRKLELMKKAKCSIADCNHKQEMYMNVGIQMLPFCMEHFIKLQELKPELDGVASLIDKDMRRSNGEMVIIKSYEEYKRRVKKHFQELVSTSLSLTKGKCVYCGAVAVGCRVGWTPICERCMGFPLKVLKVSLKELNSRD